MTIAQLVECIVGKSCAISGNIGDGTAFNKIDVNTIAEKLENYGYPGTRKRNFIQWSNR